MKKELSPLVIVASVVVVLLVVGGLWYALSGRETGLYTEKGSGPADSGGRGGRASARGGADRAAERAAAK